MSNFSMHNTAIFSLQNAYNLALASQIAYENKETIRDKVTKEWGLEDFCFFDVEGCQGFIMSGAEFIVTAFRGTERNIEDWLIDIDFELVDGPLDSEVHSGFYNSLSHVWKDIERTIARFRQNKPKSIWFTGHSLGAAMATLAVARFIDNAWPVNGLYTFGQPRTGNQIFARNLNLKFKPYIFRFVNNNDIVTRIPPRQIGYRHVGTLKYFKENGDLTSDISSWERFLDSMRGRIEDILEWGTDGIKDHKIDNYVRLIENYGSIKLDAQASVGCVLRTVSQSKGSDSIDFSANNE
ncbi:MAG: lipase family protein [Pseudomonadota bacterium]